MPLLYLSYTCFCMWQAIGEHQHCTAATDTTMHLPLTVHTVPPPRPTTGYAGPSRQGNRRRVAHTGGENEQGGEHAGQVYWGAPPRPKPPNWGW